METNKTSLIAWIVVIAVVVLGAFYFWNNRGSNDLYEQNPTANQEANSSDAAADIEAELNATDVESTDYDLNEENFNAS